MSNKQDLLEKVRHQIMLCRTYPVFSWYEIDKAKGRCDHTSFRCGADWAEQKRQAKVEHLLIEIKDFLHSLK